MIDMKELSNELGFDAEDLAMLLDMFIDGCETSLQELSIAIDEENFADIKTAAHAIKGSAANLRLTKIYNCASKIELSAINGEQIKYSDLALMIEEELFAIKSQLPALC